MIYDYIIGPDRRDQLIQAAADRIVLHRGISPDAARRYATTAYENCDPAVILAPGQVWKPKKGDGEPFTVVHIDRDSRMAEDNGSAINFDYLTAGWTLTDWPTDASETPQPPTEPTTTDDNEDDEDDYNPHHHYLIIERADHDPQQRPPSTHLAMSGEHYTTHIGKDGKTPFVFLDLPTYLAAHLADYRDGWQQWHDTVWTKASRTERVIAFFNELGGSECDREVAAWLGHWLHERVQSDAAREHGGAPTDFEVLFMWGAHMADEILPAVAGSDPREPLPGWHELAQVAGQSDLFGAVPAGGVR